MISVNPASDIFIRIDTGLFNFPLKKTSVFIISSIM